MTDATNGKVANPALAEHANAIRALRSRIVGDVAEIGRRLIEVKRLVGHGNWLPWLDCEFGWSEDTAERFIRVHEFVERLSDSASVRNLVLTIPISSVYLLAAPSTPDEARDRLIARAQAGEALPIAEVKRVITRAKGKQPTTRKRRTLDEWEADKRARETKAVEEGRERVRRAKELQQRTREMSPSAAPAIDPLRAEIARKNQRIKELELEVRAKDHRIRELTTENRRLDRVVTELMARLELAPPSDSEMPDIPDFLRRTTS